jgi:DNA-binding CsgD family transcriptional regulator
MAALLNPPVTEAPCAGELARIAAEELSAIPFPALVLEIPSQRIVASVPAATRLLDPEGGMIVGHRLEEFMTDEPDAAVGLLAGGRLDGAESSRVLRRSRGADLNVRLWIRSFDHLPPSKFVLVVIAVSDPDPPETGRDRSAQDPAVVGTANARLLIEWITSEAQDLFHLPMSHILNSSLLALVAELDVPKCLTALSEATSSRHSVQRELHARAGLDGQEPVCEVLIQPLSPSPSCAFVFQPIPGGAAGERVSSNLSAILLRASHAALEAERKHGPFHTNSKPRPPGLSQLSTRELEVLTRLLDGDRPPAIALKLFVSQSTVRSHLASAYAKLGVTSQQALLDKFR